MYNGYLDLYNEILDTELATDEIPEDYIPTIEYVLSNTELSKYEVNVIRARFSLDSGEKKHTFQEIGDSIGVSRENTWYHYKRGMKKLKKPYVVLILNKGLDKYTTDKEFFQKRNTYRLQKIKLYYDKVGSLLYVHKIVLGTECKILREIDMDVLQLPTKAYNALNSNLTDISILNLIKMSDFDYLNLYNFGIKCLKETKSRLNTYIEDMYGISTSEMVRLLRAGDFI